MPGSVSNNNVHKVYAQQDGNKDEKVVLSEAKSDIESASVFTQTKNAQADIIKTKTTGIFNNVPDTSVTQTVAKYLNGTSLAQILENSITSKFDTIQYASQEVHSSESDVGYHSDGDAQTDASGEAISRNTTGYSQALTAEIKNKIEAQVKEIADEAKAKFESKLSTAIKQAKSELVKGEQQDTYANTEEEKGKEFDKAVHTYTSASQGKKDVGSAGYEATYATLVDKKGFKVKIRNVDGQDLKVISYKEGGETKHVIIDDEGNIHELNETKSSLFRKNSYLTDEGLDAMRDVTGNNDLEAKDVKILKRKTTDADSGTTSKESIAVVKQQDGKHRYSVTNDAPDGGYVDNSVSVNEAVITRDGLFRKKQFVSGDSVGTIMRNGGTAVKQNGHRTIQYGNNNIVVDNNANDRNNSIQSTASSITQRLNQEAIVNNLTTALGKLGYLLEVEDENKVTLTNTKTNKIIPEVQNLKQAQKFLNDAISDKNREETITQDGDRAKYDADKVDIRPDIPSGADSGWTTTTFEGEENVRISPKAKNVHFKRSEWNHNWSKNNQALLNNFKQNAHSAEDVFNILLENYGLDPTNYDYSKIRDVLISNNPSIFDNNGHVYKGASFAKRLDLPTKEVIEQLCKRPDA